MATKTRERSYYSDKNQGILDQIALSVYADMGIISLDDYNRVRDDVSAQIDLLQSIPDLKEPQATEFSERFIDKILDVNDNYISLVPPATLAKSYNGIKARMDDANLDSATRQHLQSNLDQITNRIDELINDFAQNVGYHFADPTNIADVYAGYNEMFDAREPDLVQDSDLRTQITHNRSALENYIQEYDSVNGISELTEKASEVKAIDDNYNKAVDAANNWTPSEETLQSASRYKFLDPNGDVKPQFVDGAGALTQDYQSGYTLNPDGELNGVIDLTRHDFALSHLKDDVVDEKTKQEIQSELDEGVLYKLFEIDTAEKIISGCQEDPNRFTDPQHFQEFVQNLNANGGQISAQGYEAALDAQVNKTGGLAGRIKQKLGKFAGKATGFFQKIFNPIKKIDKRASDRIQGQSKDDKRQKRIDFFVRMLKGFGSAFLVSAAITTIATAAAAVSGLSVAVAVATIGITTGIVMSAIQISKWRKQQRANGQDDSIKALLADKRMLATLGTTAIASIAMIFGASGLTTAAVALGYGALAIGGANNSISTFKDAKAAGLSTAESISWALANAAAVIAGGFAGRATANSLIDSYNKSHPDNRLFQSEENHREWQKIGEHEESSTVYNQDALDNAERIAKMWYRNDPDLLQQRVDMVNAYNAEHGTSIDPYRAVMINADAGGMTADNMALHVDGGGVVHSGGHHTVFGAQWAHDHGFTMDEINAMRHMFDGGQISESAMNAVARADAMVSSINEVGSVSAGDSPHYDGVLHQNTVDANGNPVFNTYADGQSPYTTVTNVVEDFGWVDTPVLTPVDVPWAMGMFGTYNKRHAQNLKDRAGALADKINQEATPEPQPVVPEEQEVLALPETTPVLALPERTQKEVLALPERTQREVLALPERTQKEVLALPERTQKEVLALPETTPVLALPERTQTQEPKWLRITRAQAKKLDDLQLNIETTQRQLSNPKLGKSKHDKYEKELKRWKQELRELKNKLGNPTPDDLENAQYWAWRKEDLEIAETRLENVKKRKVTGNTSKHEIAEIQREIAELEKKIADYKAEIPDESLFYDPVAVQYDKEQGRKVQKFDEATKRVQEKQRKKVRVIDPNMVNAER